jgi:flavin reductase (DIM6/NTAB) family NADH-FMN oxidoreductase RutF
VTPDDFRETLACWASGVTVVATTLEGRRYGLTASSFTSVSLAPPLVLVCVDRRAESCDALLRSGRFGVSLLAAGSAGRGAPDGPADQDKFDGLRFRDGEHLGQPLLEGALAHLECRLFRADEAGDHLIFLGEVCAVSVSEGAPLLYFQRRFRGLA